MPGKSRKTVIVPHGTDLPPPRPGVRHVKVPLLGIVIADDELRDRIEHRFHWPMILLALAILPLFAIEFVQKPTGWLRWGVDLGFAVIWLAFLVEFVIKVAIAESRFEYCKRNWIDIVIILLPVLRVFRIARLARTSRVFRLRGVGMKFARYALTIILGLSATERFLERVGVKLGRQRKDPLKMTRYQLIDELKKLRKTVDAWEQWYEAQEEYAAKHGGPDFHAPKPEMPEEADEEPEREASAIGDSGAATEA